MMETNKNSSEHVGAQSIIYNLPLEIWARNRQLLINTRPYCYFDFFILSDIHICSISPSATEQAAPTVQRICVYVRLCASCWSRPAFMHGLAGFWSYSFCGTFNSIFDSTEYAGPQLSMRWEMVSTCVRQHLGLDENPLYCKDRVQ